MINAKCGHCGKTFSLNDTFLVADSTLCKGCAEEFHKTHKDIPIEEFKRQRDQTVCINCGKDNGSLELPILAGQPVCEQCMTYFKNRPYPPWIKLAMAGLAAIVVFSFVWNWRFVQAYMDLRNIKAAVRTADIEKASKLFHSAAVNVPEAKWLSAMATVYDGIQMLKEDKSAEAMKLFNSCKADIPPGFPMNELIQNAECGIAFDEKDYDKFLAMAIQKQDSHPNDPFNVAQVASAYACKYAVTDDEQFKQQSLDLLNKSKSMFEKKGGLDRFEEYEDRILYRIETREIISRNEFNKKFPNGWKKQQKEQNK
jgi:hypothetical protein